jgi:sugar lactone lactonase YvrE
MHNVKNFLCYALFLSLLTGAALLGGCATTPKPEAKEEAVFFPDPPAPPRLQYLRSFTTSDDIAPGAGAFDSFLTGSTTQGYHLVKPYGVTIKDGKLYVCDSQATVVVFDLKDKKFQTMEGAKGLGKVVQPLNISLDEQGNKFVADPVRGEVLMYDSKDFYVKSFGVPGQWKPVDSAAYEGLLYVVDSKEKEIKVFDIASGEKINSFGRNNKPEENLGLPTGIAIGVDELLYISDSGRFQVVVYDRDGHQRSAIGRPGANLGHFARPRGVATDREGRVFAVDAAFENVQIFRNDGQLLLFFGGSGTGPGKLFLPADVYIDYDNIEYFRKDADPNFDIEYLVFVTSQFGDRLVNVYGFGKERGRTYPSEEEMIEKAGQKLKQWQQESK